MAAASSFSSRPYGSSGLVGRSAGGAAGASGAAGGARDGPAPGLGLGSGFGGAGAGAGTGVGHSHLGQHQREAQRLERERIAKEEQQQGHFLELSDEQREEINEAFSLFDLDKDSHVDYHETKVALKALGFDLQKQEILAILQTHGLPVSSVKSSKPPVANPVVTSGAAIVGPARLVISLATFQAVAAERVLARDPRDEILRAFELFDETGKGKINIDDLRRVARELGEGLQEDELFSMIDEFDLDGDGMISRDEFVAICLG